VSAFNSIITFLLLEDSRFNVDSIELCLKQINNKQFKLFKFSNLKDSLNCLQYNSIDIILIAIKLEHIYETKIQDKIYTVRPNIPIIFLIADQNEEKLIQSENLNVILQKTVIQDYIVKQQLSPYLLEKSIVCALAQQKMTKQIQYIDRLNLQLKSQLEETQELFETIVDSTSTLIWMIDIQENYTFLNQSWLSFTGQTLDEALKENWRDRIHPGDLTKCNEIYNAALNQCQEFQIEYRLRRFDNTYRTILNTAVRRQNLQGEFAGLLCSCLDITQRKKFEQKVVRQAHTDSILANITQDIHSSLNLDIILQTATEQVNQYLMAARILITKFVNNNQLTLLFGTEAANSSSFCNLVVSKQLPNQELIDNFERLSKGEIIGSNNISLTEIMNLGDEELLIESDPLLLVPIRQNKKIWGLICVEQNLPPRCWRLDEIKLLERVAIQLGIAIQQSELYQELEKLSVIDGLTKIANRRKFDQYLAIEWKRLTREQKPLSLILCDVDHFKLYNDTYGHQQGDRCLQKIAQAISQVIKRPADLVARYGGEEFVVVLPDTDLNGAKYLAQQIRLKVASLKIPHINSPVDLYATLSFGLACCIPNHHQTSCDTLISAADRGLYQAKELGRNRVVESIVAS
jgi:diguanylate cyclase (GGDEF)-like protein/PAS domain S-box-containing protein